MREMNKSRILDKVGDGLLLDIGGWADPLPMADYVVDVCPYETRGLLQHGVVKL